MRIEINKINKIKITEITDAPNHGYERTLQITTEKGEIHYIILYGETVNSLSINLI